jgi:hypothetical protein
MSSNWFVRKACLWVALGAWTLAPPSVSAAIVSFQYAGTITSSQDTSNLLGGAFKAGDSYVGQVTYDTADAKTYFSPNVYYFLSGAQISLTSGGHTFVGSTAPSTPSCWPSASPGCTEPFNVSVTNNGMAGGDRLAYSGPYLTYDGATAPGSPMRGLLQLRLVDSSQTALADEALPSSAPSISDFDRREVEFFARGSDFMAPPLYAFSANVTSITPVPEPGTTGLFAAGLCCVFAWVARGKQQPRVARSAH